ncbi:DNA polymerase I [Spiroplasma culicicola]|uniref:DNA polymerase I n=1 Tax=Spiroplasma culicicola AES-1 TaxID=1276246 RepID=W6A8E0_9MOLU|nr:DNA polymerase I [Spiroplasma culicicola]AHI53216.1 DNA polymerase I [Spiroplasma culicicola AES-1]
MTKKILLVDGNALIFRAFYSSFGRATLTTRDGTPTNAVFSFINMLFNIMNKNNYFDIKVAFDKGKKTFRHDKLESYKDGRKKTPPELIKQFPIVREFLTQANIDWYEYEGYEADDIIGTISYMLKDNLDYQVDILTSDQDMYQLISQNTFVLSPQTGTSDILVYDKQKLFEKWGISPEQVIDYKGLRGDSSDNIKGVAGIGEKSAKELLQEFGDLDNLYLNVDKIKGAKQQKLIDGKEDAFLSKEIATIYTGVEIDNFEFRETQVNFDSLKDFFTKYEMNSMIRKYCNDVAQSEVDVKSQIQYQIIDKWESNFSAEINFINLEILNDNYHNYDIVGFAIVNSKGNFFYTFNNAEEVNIFNWQESNVDEALAKFLLNSKFYTYDVKKTIYVLEDLGYKLNYDNFVFDMMIACYVLNSNVKSNFESHLNLVNSELLIATSEEIFGKGVKRSKNIDQKIKVEYVISKAMIISQIYEDIITQLKETNQYELYQQIELPLSFVLLKAEQEGVLIDRDELKIQTANVLTALEKVESEAQDIIKEAGFEAINLASPKQLKELLFDNLNLRNWKKGSTDKEVLDELINDHPIIEKILLFRKYSKLYSTYLSGFEKYIYSDNKVHTIYHQTLTNTGRLSSVEPNLQNISVRDELQKEVRKIFITPKGYSFMSIDYSQIELRVLADIANEEVLIDAYENNIDIHELAARNIFNLDASKPVGAEQRRVAKVFNFGILYGLTKFGLAKDLKISHKEATDYIEAYNKTFPKIINYKADILEFCKKQGYVETMANRRRYIYELQNSNKMVQEFGKRAAINAPIQGTAADILKVAMVEIYKKILLNNSEIKIVAQIHDEIILLVQEDKVETYKQTIVDIMNNAYNQLLTISNKNRISKVKLDVNVSCAKNWYELK